MDRCDSSVTVLVTRSMLTSLNDSTMVSVPKRRGEEEEEEANVLLFLPQSLLESSGRV